MKKSKRKTNHTLYKKPIHWLPIDSRLFPSIFSFSRVKGFSRLFLEIEMVLAVGIVIGTVFVVILTVLGIPF